MDKYFKELKMIKYIRLQLGRKSCKMFPLDEIINCNSTSKQ